MSKKKHLWWKIPLIVLGVILAAVIIFFAVLTITEYKPKDTETLSIEGSASKELTQGDDFTIMTWNTGYGGLDENADFFMDGGTHVQSSDTDKVKENISAINDFIKESKADVVFLQELDTDSKRTYGLNELSMVTDAADGFQSTYALNYKTLYVPYPWPPIGKVTCGIATLSSFEVSDATRVSLPCPFKYPVRLANLKRCLMVDRVPIQGSDKELVLVNLHLEAYDDGEGKIAQTKQLRELLESEAKKGNYVIAGGDFNQTFSNCDTSAYPTVSDDMWVPGVIDVSEFDDSLQFVMDNSSPSCRSLDKPLAGNDSDPSVFQYYIIDGFIVSDNLEINKITTKNLNFKNSDHNPVIMNVTVK